MKTADFVDKEGFLYKLSTKTAVFVDNLITSSPTSVLSDGISDRRHAYPCEGKESDSRCRTRYILQYDDVSKLNQKRCIFFIRNKTN